MALNERKPRIPIWISLEDACSKLDLRRETVTDLADAGYLDTLSINGSPHFDLVAIHAFAVMARFGIRID